MESNFDKKMLGGTRMAMDRLNWPCIRVYGETTERALDFKIVVGPFLSVIKPSLVLVTGDLTDGKSKDLLTMKQNDVE